MPSASELERQAQEEAIENSPHERPANAPLPSDNELILESLRVRAKELGFDSIDDALTALESAITVEGTVDTIVRQPPAQPVAR